MHATCNNIIIGSRMLHVCTDALSYMYMLIIGSCMLHACTHAHTNTLHVLYENALICTCKTSKCDYF